ARRLTSAAPRRKPGRDGRRRPFVLPSLHRSSQPKGGGEHACTLRNAVDRGHRGGVARGAHRRTTCGKGGGRDAGGLEPRGGRAGKARVPRASGAKPRKGPSWHQGPDHLVREEPVVRGAPDRAARG